MTPIFNTSSARLFTSVTIYRNTFIMPRKYTRDPASRAYNAFDKNNLDAIVRRIKAKRITLMKAAKISGIAYGTIWNAVNKKHERQAGGQPRLSAESELAIVHSIDILTKWKVPVTGMEIKFLVKAYLDRKGIHDRRFTNNLPGQDWLKSFSRRHHLVNRMADNITPVRAEISAENISNYFDNLKNTVAGVPKENIFNYDETNFTDDPGASKIVCRRGTGRVEKKIQHGKTSISVMFCGSATGQFLPPMVVYRAKHVYTEWTTGGPAGAVYESTPSGWFDSRTFTRWFQDVFLPGTEALAASGPRLIIGDNLASHFEPAVLAMCEEKNVIFTSLLPNATHLLQPLDVSVFRPAKLHWRAILRQWKTESRSRGTLPKTCFPGLLARLCNRLEGKTLVSGFRACGIVPLDGTQVLKRIPSRNTDDANTSTLSDSVMELLERHCGPANNDIVTKRGKKMPAPGTRVRLTDVTPSTSEIQEPTPSTSGTKHPAMAKKSKRVAIDMTICYVCEQWACPETDDEDALDSWVECDRCGRWYHVSCVNDIDDPCLLC